MDDPGGQPSGLAPINLADKSLFQSILSDLKQPLSDYSFSNIFVWSASLVVYWAVIDRHLCVFANGTGDLTLLMPPLPRRDATDRDLRDCIDNCFALMDQYNDRVAGDRSMSRIEYVSDEVLERISAVGGTGLSAAPMSGDYIYSMERMIDLAGGSLKSKRHARSRFMRDFPDHRVEDLCEAHVPACVQLLDVWHHHGDDTHEGEVNDAHVGTDILRHRDSLACRRALTHWRDLGMKGMSLFVGDRLVGFTLGEAISGNQASILIEKTHPDFHGSAQFIFSEFCARYWSHLAECNVGDDWGIPTLRFTKQSYRPIRLLSKYVLTRPRPAIVGSHGDMRLPIENPPHQVVATPGAASTGATPSGSVLAESTVPSPVGDAARTASEPMTANLVVGEARMSDPARLEVPALPERSMEPAPTVAEPVLLRAGVPGDVAALLELERCCFQNLEETFNRRQIRYLIQDRRATVTVAQGQATGRILGWSVGLVREHRRCRSGRLYAVAVHPEVQGRHIGKALVEHTLASLDALGIARVYLEVREDNASALRLYRKLGFADRGVLPNYYGQGRHGRRMMRLAQIPSVTAATRGPRFAGSPTMPVDHPASLVSMLLPIDAPIH